MMKINEQEKQLYEIISTLSGSNLPLVFKGALILKAAINDSQINRHTYDIDCDWISNPPTSQELERKLNEVISTTIPSVSFKLTRDYIVGKRSAGFDIYKDNELISEMDMSISSSSPSSKYYFGEIEFVGYSIENIIADKTTVLSSNKIFRRTKDFLDIYSVLTVCQINKRNITNIIKSKERTVGDFDSFFNRKEDLKHSFELLKGVINKPDFDIAYNLVSKYVEGFLNPETNLIWVPSKQEWIEEKSF